MRSVLLNNIPIKTSLLLRFHFRSISPMSSSSLIPPKLASSSASPIAAASSSSSSSSSSSLPAKLWINSRPQSTFALYTPFLLALASGKLLLHSFRSYISQDLSFLQAFSHAYELAEECVDDDDDAKIVIEGLRKDVLEELKMHHSFAQEWGIDPSKEGSINSATVKYTDFLLATASGKVEGMKGPGKLSTPFERTKLAAYTLGAMTPCMRLYAFLGRELQPFSDSEGGDHPYKKWIDNYSSDSFQESALQTEELLDKLSVTLTGEEIDIIEKLYHQAMKLEIEFFCAQPIAQPTVVPLMKEHNPEEDQLIIFTDFDLTCTVVDSSAILAEIAIVTAPKSDQPRAENQIARMSSAELRNEWTLLSGQYTEEFEQCIESILPPERVEFNYEALHKALEKLSDFERKANARVVESRVLKGINVEDIKRAGERLALQDGCTSFYQKILKNEKLNANVHVLSYCWCGDLIRSALSSGGLDIMNVHANEFAFEESVSTGEIVRKVESPMDKIQAFTNVLENYKDKKNLTIYIGDSVADLLCLLQADIGIVIGSSSSLRRVGTQFGVSFVPLFPGLVKKQQECIDDTFTWKGQSGILYTVSSWVEIHAFILGY